MDDYRLKSLEGLFQELSRLGINLDQRHFLAFCDELETPEDLADLLASEAEEEDPARSDQIYLIVFELWRRLIPEKQTLSLFCDEFDHLIDLYDVGKINSPEPIEDMIATFIELLSEANDRGNDPQTLYESVLHGCAHDVEGFLYDFIAMQIEARNFTYAEELTETFLPYVIDTRWFKFLQTQVLSDSDPDRARLLIQELVKECKKEPEPDFNLELLAYLAKTGEERSFLQLVQTTMPLLKTEEDFWDLLSSFEDYYHFKDRENEEKFISDLRMKRHHNDPTDAIHPADPDLLDLQRIL